MKQLFIVMGAILLSINAYAQNKITFIIKDGGSHEELIGASAILVGTTSGISSDVDGIATINNVPNGNQKFTFSYMGYETESKSFVFPLTNNEPIIIYMEEDATSLSEVVISTTRGTRTFHDIPTRIEFIGGEELEEKSVMKPGDIRMLLSESTGIVTQQTSAASGNSSIKIQGLDGRYTQILKDGFPMLSGAASGLGLMQTPPVDLKQVEIVKGSSSTLYGGGAIAGLVNLVSKTPTDERDLTLHVNGTSGNGLDINSFYGEKFDKVGVTVFSSYNRNWAYDPSNVGFSAIPKFDRIQVNPKLFLYPSENTNLVIGLSSMFENRVGGDMDYLKNRNTQTYFERNKTQRHSSQITFNHRFDEHNSMNIKNSVSYFDRKVEIPTYTFDGNQISTFSEASFTHSRERTEWVAGLNLWTDKFDERNRVGFPERDSNIKTGGLFIQNNTKLTDWMSLETGLRTDYVSRYGAIVLPRIAAFFKITDKLSSRVGGGFGYKTPSIFTDDSERIQFQNVVPINTDLTKLEKSYGANIDFTYKTGLFDNQVFLTLNQLFFYTYLKQPLELKLNTDNLWEYNNIDGNINSKGLETNIKLVYDDFTWHLGYTLTHAQMKDEGFRRQQNLTPKHTLNSVLFYEWEEKWIVGYETFYTGKQRLNDNLWGKDFWTFGLMVQRRWDKISVYTNFENFTDRRQTRFDTIYTGNKQNPTFRDIYAPLEGFVFNAGIILKL